MRAVMVIGASRGIGLELVRQYLAEGCRVHATTRTLDKPGALGRLAGDLALHELDVCNADQIAALRQSIADEGIDVLIHNAGVYGKGMSRETVMHVNAEAPIQVTGALFDAVLRGKEKKIVLMTSQMGARRGNRGDLGDYGESKALLNDRFRELAPAWGQSGIIAIVMHPGWVRTDMGGQGAALSPRESVAGIRNVIARMGPQDHGRFWTWDGREHPW
ncbi:MAG: SDR family NAD(P)-dependent oxidoreductase [Gammaproteobacteria bacterium]|nr:SDR family NAD(P)-dependent oxidoreductase [Gammaproteobacteria bacterium]